jgi:hypothetical protein
MLMLHYGTPRDQEARKALAAALPDAEVSVPDDIGVFEVLLEAEDLEHALRRVLDVHDRGHRAEVVLAGALVVVDERLRQLALVVQL